MRDRLWVRLALALAACGSEASHLAPPGARSSQPIVGGAASAGAYGAVGALLIEHRGASWQLGELRCTGTLIAPDTVLTAAHCLEGLASQGDRVSRLFFTFAEDVSAYAATLALPPHTFEVARTVQHPEFSPEALSAPLSPEPVVLGVDNTFFDVGLAYLAEPVFEREPAALVTEHDVFAEGDAVEVVGYGQRSLDVSSLDADDGIKHTASSFINAMGATEMQIGDDESPRKCHGDSGGPTFRLFDVGGRSVRRLIGVGSHAYDDSGSARGGVDTRIDVYLRWIDEAMQAACESGARPTCDEAAARERGCGSVQPALGLGLLFSLLLRRVAGRARSGARANRH